MCIYLRPTLNQAINHITEIVRPKFAQRANGTESLDHYSQDEWISDLFTGAGCANRLIEAVRIKASTDCVLLNIVVCEGQNVEDGWNRWQQVSVGDVKRLSCCTNEVALRLTSNEFAKLGAETLQQLGRN